MIKPFDPAFDAKVISYPFDEELTSDDIEPGEELNPEDTAVIIFTSGASGNSKGVELSFNNLLQSAKIGDKIFFYIIKEKVLDGYAVVNREYYEDDTPVYSQYDGICYRRLGIKFAEVGRGIDFKKELVPKLNFIKRKQGISFSSYLVRNFFQLTDEDASTISESFK